VVPPLRHRAEIVLSLQALGELGGELVTRDPLRWPLAVGGVERGGEPRRPIGVAVE
jgi:hypothetical protein